MAEGKRPGGLTALAVLNFIFGGLDAIGTLGALALVSLAKSANDAVLANGGTSTYDGPSAGVIYIYVLLLGLLAALLIASGVGYIKQKRGLGRTVGNAYAIISLATTAVGVALVHSGFGIGTIIGLVYPVLTLILLNTTFKDDLVN